MQLALPLLRVLALLIAAPVFTQEPVLPDPSGALTVRGGEEASTLLEVTERYAELLDLPLTMSSDARAVMGRAPVGLLADAEVPAEAVHAFAQSLLVLGGFVITGVEEELAVAAYAAGAAAAWEVDAEGLERLAGFEATLVRVPAEIPGIDAPQLAVSLRAVMRPGLPGPVMVARDDGVFEFEGPAEGVRQLLQVLRRCASEEPAKPAAVAWDELFPPLAPGAEFGVNPDEKLLDVLERYVLATGRNLWIEPRLKEQLRHQAAGLLAPVTCRAAQVHTLVEGLLAQSEAAVTVRGVGRHAVHAVQRGYWTTPTRPVLADVAGEDLARLRAFPATIFGGVLRTESLDTRMATTSLRVLMADPNTQAALALQPDSIYVVGGGARAAHLGAVLVSLDGGVPGGDSAVAGLGDDLPFAFAVPTEGEDGPLTLFQLVEAWADAGGYGVLVSDVDERFLMSQELDLSADEGRDVHALVEEALAERELALSVIATEPKLVAILGRATRRRGDHRFVAGGELDSLERRGSMLVSTLVPLEKIDPRVAATRVRSWFRYGQQQYAIAPGGAGLVLGGPVDAVREHAKLLREHDEAGRLPDFLRGR